MKSTYPNTNKVLFWLPRLLAILFIVFIGIFALDMFGTGEPWYKQIGGFFMHLVPNYILVAALIFAWRHEKLGGIIFLILYFAAIFFFRGEITGLILFSPLILIGTLFIFDYLKIEERKGA